MKLPKGAVDYSKGMKSANCGICKFYSENTCSKVKGNIDPDMWCRIFEKKA